MAARRHRYALHLRWEETGAAGTTGYAAYGREHVIGAAGKPDIMGSSDPAFRGDGTRWSPEELLLAALSACHQLWYLHLCAEAGVVVVGYEDHAEAVMREQADGAGQFESATLRPVVTLAAGDEALATALHARAAAQCFIARSVNFPVRHEVEVRWRGG